VSAYRNGRQAEDLSGPVLLFGTARGERVVLVPKGTSPAPVHVP